MIWLSIIANLFFLIVSFPTWAAATILGWLVWYLNVDVGYADLYKFQLGAFLFSIPALANRNGNVGIGVVASGAIGYILGKNTAKM